MSSTEAMRKVLSEADGPLGASEIAKRVIEGKLAPGLKGKTPAATMAAQLYVAAKKPDGFVRKTAKGFVLRDEVAATPEPTEKVEKKLATPDPKPSKREKRLSGDAARERLNAKIEADLARGTARVRAKKTEPVAS